MTDETTVFELAKDAEGRWCGAWADHYSVIVEALDTHKSGVCWATLQVLHDGVSKATLGVNLLSNNSRSNFGIALAALNGTAPVSWHRRLNTFYTQLIEAQKAEGGASVWTQAITVQEFCQQEEADVQADAKDLIIPGAITIVAAPRASGKTLVALALGIALATGGVFRGERVPKRRVLLVDRDNPPALIRRRFRLLGGHQITGLKLLTRDKAPPLTDAAAWAAFPTDLYDVVIVDSIGAATEGVSEKEGKQTQQYLATLKDISTRGSAILALDNTNKAALNYRGRGEKGDMVDILYEARNITGWTPTQGGDWWENLPDFGEHAWQQRASRRKGQQVLRIAFIPSKFRWETDPNPFVLEIDTRQEPWTLTDITESIATAGEEAAQEQSRQERFKLEQACRVLVQAIRERLPKPLLKTEAETLLQGQGLTRRVARNLLEYGGNRDSTPEGFWVLRPIPNHPTGKALAVYLAGEEDDGKRFYGNSSPSEKPSSAPTPSASGSTPSGERFQSVEANNSATENSSNLLPYPGNSTAKGDDAHHKEKRASHEGGGPFAKDMHTSSADEHLGQKIAEERVKTRWCGVHSAVELEYTGSQWVCPLCGTITE